ncbi:unnamed protein product [Rotaria sp. Silwood2]|nr:unnamed protein product [Rotaria sp. Silwood2]
MHICKVDNNIVGIQITNNNYNKINYFADYFTHIHICNDNDIDIRQFNNVRSLILGPYPKPTDELLNQLVEQPLKYFPYLTQLTVYQSLSTWYSPPSVPVGGQCLHPDDIHEDVSGSSSGSAAGIKLNLFTFSLGTDTQGSLLSPAINVKNVCTLKPSLGTWPTQDIIPINYDQDSCGPMTRCIKDVELLHRIVSEIKENNDNYSRSLRVGYLGKFNE